MIRTILVDDQPDGLEALKLSLHKYCPQVEVLELCSSGTQAMRTITLHQPDLVFLDIQMPQMSGFDLLEQLAPVDFEVIFVTAHNQYAIKAIKFSALDYLLKPIDVEELIKAVSKVQERKRKKDLEHNYESMLQNLRYLPGAIKKLAVSSMEGLLMLETADVIFCQADGNYTKIFLQNGRTEVVTKKLKEFENILSESGFCRVHHAYLVNLNHVKQYFKGDGGYIELTEGHHVDVSRRRKDGFLDKLDRI